MIWLKRRAAGGTPESMVRVRFVVAALLASSSAAGAQPADPYAPKQGTDTVLAEQVAQQLVTRAQELFDAKVYADAKQLAREALAQSSTGPAASHARYLIKMVNAQLGLKDEAPPPPPPVKPDAPVVVKPPQVPVVVTPPPRPLEPPPDLTPIEDPTLTVAPPQPMQPVQPAFTVTPAKPEQPAAPPTTLDLRIATTVHTSLYAGLLGAMVGSLFSSRHEAAGAIPVGVAAGVAAGVYLPDVVGKLGWDEAQIRTTGAGTVWGGMLGGFFADAVTVGPTSGRQVLIGASIGATLGGVGGAILAKGHTLTRGDVALVDTFAGAGLFGGLVIGMLMQPATSEAYSVNVLLGTAGGVVVGLIAAPRVNTTPRRMLRVAGLGALGGALPFLLYAAIHDKSSHADERVTGFLSAAGIAGGLYLGFRLTDDLDVGLDTQDGKRGAVEAPLAVINRASDGSWDLGALALAPLDQHLAPQKGLALSVLGARF